MAKQRNATCPRGFFSATETKPTPLRYPKSTSYMWSAECFGLDRRVGSPVLRHQSIRAGQRISSSTVQNDMRAPGPKGY